MPELPEVETVRRGLAPHMEGQILTRVEQRRENLRFVFPDRFVERLEGQRLVSMGRRAKYLIADMADETVLIMHLGMSGSFRIETINEDAAEAAAPGAFHYERHKAIKHDHVVFHMQNGTRIIYNDPRRFGFMDLVPRSKFPQSRHFAKMGVEPTGNQLSATYLAGALKNKKTSLKAVLLDQRIIAGLGNIYVCEALWRANLSPTRGAASLVKKNGEPSKQLINLTMHIREVIQEAIEAGGSSLRDYRQADGSLGYFQHSFAAYGREDIACAKETCSGVIRRITQSGRSTFYCNSCQR